MFKVFSVHLIFYFLDQIWLLLSLHCFFWCSAFTLFLQTISFSSCCWCRLPFTPDRSWTSGSQLTSYWLWLPICRPPSLTSADISALPFSCPLIGWKSSESTAQWVLARTVFHKKFLLFSVLNKLWFSPCSASAALCQRVSRRRWPTSSRSSASINWPNTTHANIAVNTAARSLKQRYRCFYLELETKESSWLIQSRFNLIS